MSRKAKASMVAALMAVVAMAFRVSWNALKDVARAIGADPTAATVYPLVVDGLMALALVAALILVGSARSFALRVLGGYTAASLVLNYVHGLVPALAVHGAGRAHLADWAPANWALVLLATSLPVGAIFFGSDLVAKVLHHKPQSSQNDQTMTNRSGSELPVSADPDGTGPLYESPDPAPSARPTEEPTVPVPVVEPVRLVKPTAPPAARPRRATGAVPQSARTALPKRTAEELLTEARSATADWPDDELTADRIRGALRTSAANGRMLRDLLKAERAAPVALHAVPTPAAETSTPADENGSHSPKSAPVETEEQAS
ncbi:DUF2637 domain-containing protein [Kitasatospora sp. NBC_01302]|uniref:DUF2637 domain-containing protein n=1 Tax=Kitasatospora sp. NBC_01302 TaxID=2903575 RepID=UPI002E161848|nr:DUF2637 domain-containing protein [Kitasatospora sp. NBC_01302]